MFAIAHELETARLRLRMLREEDLDALAALSADPEVMRYLSADGKPVSRSQAWRSMAATVGHWQLRGYGMWALEEKASGRFVGRGGLWRPEGWPEMEVGWTLAREHWGRGFATEMAHAALAQARERLGAKRIISLIAPDNVRSIRVAEGIGETYERDITVDGAALRQYGRAL